MKYCRTRNNIIDISKGYIMGDISYIVDFKNRICFIHNNGKKQYRTLYETNSGFYIINNGRDYLVLKVCGICHKTITEDTETKHIIKNHPEYIGVYKQEQYLHFGFVKSLKCIIDGCDGTRVGKGLCMKHYKREWRKKRQAQ